MFRIYAPVAFFFLISATRAWLSVSHISRRCGCTPQSLYHSTDPSNEKKPRPSPSGFSFVEGGVYANERDAIEAMGGDPFFLEQEQDNSELEEEEEGDENAYFDG